MFDPFQHQQGVWTKARLQRYFPFHMSKENNDNKAEKQLSSIWENNNQDHTSDSDISNSNFSTRSMSIYTSNKSNNNIIEISSDHTNYQTNIVEDATKYTPTPLPTVIETDDQTIISAMTSNNYNYKKVDKVDNFIMSFLQNNNNLPTFHQQQSNTTTTKTSEDKT